MKYLPQFGWRATVVSTRSRLYAARDPELAREVPAGTRVVRAPALPLGRFAAIAFNKLGLRRAMPWVAWPDGGYGWAPAALLAAWREVRRERPDALYSTSSPYGGHLVALAIHRATGIPWVADFRDEWSTNSHLEGYPRLLRAANDRAERAITRNAAQVVIAADYFRLAGEETLDGRLTTITNGVDADDVPEAVGGEPPADRFRLTFVGTVYDSIDLAPVLRALEQLIDGGVVDPRRFELRIVGNVWIPGFAAPAGVPVTQTGYVSHEEAIAEMRSSTALLLFRAPGSLAPSGKVFEYLATERPILCATRPDNLAARLVREWDAGVVADPADVQATAAALRALYERWEAGTLTAPVGTRERVLERYSRRELTRRLAGVLDTAVAPPR